MKIGILAPYSRPWDSVDAEGSGQNVFIRESTMALAKRADVTLFRRRSRKDDAKEYQHAGVREVCIPAGISEKLSRNASFEACQEQIPQRMFGHPDVWIAHYWVSVPWVKQLLRFTNAPVLYFSHSFFGNPLRLNPVDPYHEKAERFAAQNCIWCANSSVEWKEVSYLFPEAIVKLVSPGHSKVSYESEPSITKRFLFVSRKNYAKGYDIFVELARRFHDCNFCAIGRDDMLLALPSNVTQMPTLKINDLASEICRSDVVLCPSRYEHFGLVPLLSSFCETPVLASAVGGHLDSVIHDRTGWLCKPTIESFTNGLHQIQTSTTSASLRSTGREAHKFVVNRFSWKRFVNRIISLAGSIT